MMKKFMAKAEQALGVDLDGDGKVGGQPAAGRGGYSGGQQQGGYPGQQQHGAPPPQAGGYPQPGGYPQAAPPGGAGGYPGMAGPPGGGRGYPQPGAPPPQQGGYPQPGAPPPQQGGYPQPGAPPYGAQPGPPGGAYGQPPPQQGGYPGAAGAPPYGAPPGGAPGGYGAQPGPPGAYGAPPGGPPGMCGGAPPGGGGGKVKALLIGINYTGQQGQLSGCVNDVKTIQSLLRKLGFATRPGYQEVVLVDDRAWPGAMMPTKAEILRAFQWLATGNSSGDTLFFHYSGHGGQVRDLDGDEGDGYDETLIPVDYKQAGQITDDEIFLRLVRPLPQGCRLTAVMDCCHSGTAMDLPYCFKASQQHMQGALANPGSIQMIISNKKERNKLLMQMGMGLLGGGGGGGGGFFGGGTKAGKADQQKHANADVVMFSGCDDSQTSADVPNVAKFGLPATAGPGGSGGACTNALAAVLHRSPQITIVQLLEQMRAELKKRGFKQVPQLTSSKPVDMSVQFNLFGPISQSRAAPVQAPPGYWGAYAQGPQAGFFGGQAPAGGYPGQGGGYPQPGGGDAAV